MKTIDNASLLIVTTVVNCAFVFSVVHGNRLNRTVTVAVYRRQSGDIYELNYHDDNKIHNSCEGQQTYMVEERACLKNEDIFGSASRPMLYLLSSGIVDVDTHISLSEHTNCQIDSLKVHRGRETFMEIDSFGFTLTSSNGTIKVQANQDSLAYSKSEYAGELYQVKFVCSDPQNTNGGSIDQHLSFVVGGRANVSYPKFNCSVPGTLYTYTSPECPLAASTTTTTVGPNALSQEATSSLLTTLTKNTSTSTGPGDTKDSSDDTLERDTSSRAPFEVGSPLFYATVGAGGGVIVMFLSCLVCVCVVLIYKHNKVKVSAITNISLERRCSVASKQMEPAGDKELELCIYDTPGEVVQSNMYGSNCLEQNPAYKEPGSLSSKKDKVLECDYATVSEHQNQLYDYCSTEEPIYQEITPQLCSVLTAKCGSSDELTTVTAHNNFYEASFCKQKDCCPCTNANQ